MAQSNTAEQFERVELPGSSSPKTREALKKQYEDLIVKADHPGSGFTKQDLQDMRIPVQGENFDTREAAEKLKTLPRSIEEGEKTYKKVTQYLRQDPQRELFKDHALLKDSKRVEDLNFGEKSKLLHALENTEIAYKKMQKWKAEGMPLSEANILHKLKTDFISKSPDEQKQRAESLENLLGIQARREVTDIYSRLPELQRRGHLKQFQSLPLEEAMELTKTLFVQAFKGKIGRMQIPDPAQEGLSLFSTEPMGKRDSSADQYAKWFEGQELAKMPEYFEKSDLEHSDRGRHVREMVQMLRSVKNPTIKRTLRDEFNSAELTARGIIVKKYTEELPEGAENEPATVKEETKAEDPAEQARERRKQVAQHRAEFQHILEEQASGTAKTDLQKDVVAFALQSKIVEQRQRAERRFNTRTVEGLQEAIASNETQVKKERRMVNEVSALDKDISRDQTATETPEQSTQIQQPDQPAVHLDSLKLKTSKLHDSDGALSALRREVKKDHADSNAIRTSVRLIGESGNEMHTEAFEDTELARLREHIEEHIAEVAAGRAEKKGLKLTAEEQASAIQTLNWEKAQQKVFDNAA